MTRYAISRRSARNLDCDIEVLLFQFFIDSENRTVWEHYLALEHEALQTVLKAIDRARMEIVRPATDRT